MKKLYTVLTSLALFSATSVMAQSFVHTPEQHRIDTVQAENFETYDINFTTPSPEAITFEWELISNSFPSAWSYSLCDHGACYVGVPAGATMNHITLQDAQNGQEGYFKINLTVGQNYGEGTVVLYVYDQNDYNRGDTVSFHVIWPEGTGIDENEIENVSFYPNPVVNNLMVSNDNQETLNITVTDVVGKTVYNGSINGMSTRTLDVSAYRSGIYFLTYFDNEGNKITKKFIKK